MCARMGRREVPIYEYVDLEQHHRARKVVCGKVLLVEMSWSVLLVR